MIRLFGFLTLVLSQVAPVTAQAQIIINEIHADPASGLAGDANGDGVRHQSQDEFVELVNSSSSEADLSGWTLSDGVGVKFTFPPGSVVPGKCAIVVFGGGNPTGSFGGALVETEGSLGLNNTGDKVTLHDGTSAVAIYTYGSEGGSDQSITRAPDITGSEPLVKHTDASGAGGRLFSPGTKVDGSAFSGCSAPTTGSIKVKKQTDPSGGSGFSFSGDLGSFLLDDGGENLQSDLSPGDYDITETVPTAWLLEAVQVTGAGSTDIASGATVHLQAGDAAVVTFKNKTSTPQTTSVIINEVDSDTPGIDKEEFIELFDGGSGSTSLDGMVIVLFNGGDDASYGAAIDLDGEQTDSNGYFVLGNSAVSNVDKPLNDNTLQNGPDAVALYFGNGSDFPNNTPVTTSSLIDAVVYDTDDADDSGLLTLLSSGPQVNENGAGNKDGHSIQRIPNGAGGARKTGKYIPIPPTPGEVNVEPPDQSDLEITKEDDVDPAFVGDNITYTLTVSNNGPETAINVTASDTLPAGLAFVSVSSSQGSASESGGIVTATLGDLANGDQVEIDIVVATATTGTFTNSAAVTSDTDDPDTDNNHTTEETQVVNLPTTSVIINEIDSDSPGTGDQEFIELFDGGSGGTSLDGMVVVLFNGGDDASYKSFDLDGHQTDGSGYFVLGSAGLANVDKTLPNATLQNGPDAVALYFGDDFPNDTPVTTNRLIDAVVYDTDDADDGGLLALLKSGQPQVNENGGADGQNHSLQRIPNGSGGARKTSTYLAIPPTPGTKNVKPPEPDIAVSPASLDFGEREAGKERDRDLTVTNEGFVDLIVDSTVVTDANADQWSVTKGEAPFSLAPRESRTVQVCFNPTSDGDMTAFLRIRSNDSDEDPVEVALTGTGLAPNIAGPLDKVKFHTVFIGQEKERKFRIRNDGNADLVVDRITIGGSNGRHYRLDTMEVPFQLEPGEDKQFTGIFAPDTIGVLRGLVRFYSNDPDKERLGVGLLGEGQVDPSLRPEVVVEPTSLDYDSVAVGASVARAITVRNDSAGVLEVSGAVFTGPDADQWQFGSGAPPFSLLQGASQTVAIRFSPTSLGDKVAQVELSSNDPEQPTVVVSLTGTGRETTEVGFEGIVVINEIHYNPATIQGPDSDFEFLELHNRSDDNIGLAGFSFTTGINHTFVEGDTLRARGFLVVTIDSSSYPGSVQWTSGGLVNSGELVALADPSAVVIDSVVYGISTPWPSDANGKGPSLELSDPALDNSLPLNWHASLPDGGTPGSVNSNPEATEPDIATNPAVLQHGNVEVGAGNEQTLTVSNIGGADLNVTAAAISGADAALWQITAGEAPVTVAAGMSHEIVLRFTPDAEGEKTAALTLTSNDPDEPTVTVPLTGTGIISVASPFAGVVVINELHYNPATSQGSDTEFEFLELANTSAAELALDGFAFSAGIEHVFAAGTTLPANGFVVLAKTAATYPGSVQWDSGNLVNSGEPIRLLDADGLEVDTLAYGNSAPWPSAANGSGPSLELKSPTLDNSLADNWQASAALGGTPGASNSDGGLTGPNLAVAPSQWDFGILNLAISETAEIVLQNQGDQPLQVESLALLGDAAQQFALRGEAVPFTLEPGQRETCFVDANPTLAGAHEAVLQISSTSVRDSLVEVPIKMFINSPPEQPQLLAPDWGEATQLLSWRRSADPDPADTVKYQVELALQEDFSQVATTIAGIADTSQELAHLQDVGDFVEGGFYYWRVAAMDNHSGVSPQSVTGYFQLADSPTQVSQAQDGLPATFALAQNYPNPFNPETRIQFELAERATVSLVVFDLRGREVQQLVVREERDSGLHSVVWRGRNANGTPAPSGIYFYRLSIETLEGKTMAFVRRMLLLK